MVCFLKIFSFLPFLMDHLWRKIFLQTLKDLKDPFTLMVHDPFQVKPFDLESIEAWVKVKEKVVKFICLWSTVPIFVLLFLRLQLRDYNAKVDQWVSYGSFFYQMRRSFFCHTITFFLTLKFFVYVLKLKVIDVIVALLFVFTVLSDIIKLLMVEWCLLWIIYDGPWYEEQIQSIFTIFLQYERG